MTKKQLLIIIPILVIVIVAILILSGTLYTIDESEQVVITQFGKIIGDPITEPGMHVKMPFIHQANYFDKRLLDWEGEKTVSKTLEQKFINVEVYARWRIIDPKLFLQTVSGRIATAQSRLDAVIDPIVRDFIARYMLKELVRSDTEKPIMEKILKGTIAADERIEERRSGTASTEPSAAEEVVGEIIGTEEEIYEERESWIEHGRDKITREIFESARIEVTRFGIELADVRIKRINYQPETRRQVYNRMIAERRREEALYISQGEQKAAEITGRKDREIKLIQSTAQEAVLKTLGEGEAEAIEIYAQAYEKDADFYRFYKTLETLRATITDGTWLIISTDSEFYRILKQAGGAR
jgi:membrane protease subunit HflC